MHGWTALDRARREGLKELLRAVGATLTVAVEGSGQGSARGPPGNVWTAVDCAGIPLCAAATDGALQAVRFFIVLSPDPLFCPALPWFSLPSSPSFRLHHLLLRQMLKRC